MEKSQVNEKYVLTLVENSDATLSVRRMATQRNTDAINKFNHNSDVIKKQYKNISDLLCELLGRANLCPYEKPKFKDDCGHILLNSLYLTYSGAYPFSIPGLQSAVRSAKIGSF